MDDLQDLKDRLDLLGEIEKDLGPGKKSGRWVQFSCPFPGHAHGDHNPSLGVTPDNGRFYCFTCGKKGDLITWLLEYRGLSWKEIHDLAGCDHLPPARPRPAAPPPAPSGPPAAAWQARGLAFVADCERRLWTPEGARALAYLQDKRGLTPDTIRAFRLGYNPADTWDTRPAWGLEELNPVKGVWLPRGIVIPWLVGGSLWAVNMRRPVGDPKYFKISGSQGALYNADWLRGADLVILCEGEFDAMVCHQALNDVAGCATLGSASKGLDLATWGAYLLPPVAILAAYDPDKAGKEGAAKLTDLTQRAHAVRVPRLRAGDKDISDYHAAGGDLWEWVKYNLTRLDLWQALGVKPQDLAADLPQALPVGELAPARVD